MQLVERHIIDTKDSRWEAIDQAAFKSKNLYNAALYVVRQSYIFEKKYLNCNQMDKLMKQHEAYKTLPAKVAQKVLKQLDEAWTDYFKACQAYKEDPFRFTSRPKLPKYKHKSQGRNMLIYTLQALSGGEGKGALQRGIIKPSRLAIEVRTQHKNINQVRIVPKNNYYVVEVIYEQAPIQANVDLSLYAGLDPGVTNLAAIASNKKGFVPRLVNGRPIKATNQYYNKRIKQLKKKLPTSDRDRITKRIQQITTQRNRRIEHAMHTTSRRIVDLLVEEGIGTLVIGKNDGWKQGVEMGKRNNQAFVCIPHARFISMLTYKAELVGIKVILTEESYTSKASFLNLDEMPVYDPKRTEEPKFSGRREGRFYYTKDGRCLHADVQGALNMIRKVTSEAFNAQDVVDGVVVHPVRIVIPVQSQKASKK